MKPASVVIAYLVSYNEYLINRLGLKPTTSFVLFILYCFLILFLVVTGYIDKWGENFRFILLGPAFALSGSAMLAMGSTEGDK